jgi:hypothetical protein
MASPYSNIPKPRRFFERMVDTKDGVKMIPQGQAVPTTEPLPQIPPQQAEAAPPPLVAEATLALSAIPAAETPFAGLPPMVGTPLPALLPPIPAQPNEEHNELMEEIPFPEPQLHQRRRTADARGPPSNQRGWRSDRRTSKRGGFGRGDNVCSRSANWMKTKSPCGKDGSSSGDSQETPPEDPPVDDETEADHDPDFHQAKQD